MSFSNDHRGQEGEVSGIQGQGTEPVQFVAGAGHVRELPILLSGYSGASDVMGAVPEASAEPEDGSSVTDGFSVSGGMVARDSPSFLVRGFPSKEMVAQEQPSVRTCGTCSACCRWPSIPEVGKLARIACSHLCGGKFGCDQYDDRPKTCSDYLCSWMYGNGEEEDRPNVCHILIDMKRTKWGPALVAKSMRSGAVRSRMGMLAIRRIAETRGALCFIVDDKNSVRVIGMAGPKELLAAFQKAYGQPMEILPPDMTGSAIVANAYL